MQAPVVFEEVQLRGTDDDLWEKQVSHALKSLKRNGVGLKGVTSTPVGPGSKASVNVYLRLETKTAKEVKKKKKKSEKQPLIRSCLHSGQLDLFASVVECKSMPNVPARLVSHLWLS